MAAAKTTRKTTAKKIPPAPNKAAPSPSPQGAAAALDAASTAATEAAGKGPELAPADTANPAKPETAKGPAPAPKAPARTQAEAESPPTVPIDEHGLKWSDDVGVRGRVITVTKGDGPTTTYEEVLTPGKATDEDAEAARNRLRKRFLAA